MRESALRVEPQMGGCRASLLWLGEKSELLKMTATIYVFSTLIERRPPDLALLSSAPPKHSPKHSPPRHPLLNIVMEPILKALKDYSSWKNNLKSVLDKNISEVINLSVDAVGINCLIPIEEVAFNSAPSGPPYSSFQQAAQPAFSNQIVKGIVINDVPNTPERLIWFYNRGNYYLINHEKNASLNLQPYLGNPAAAFSGFRPPSFIASFDVQIDFLLAFIDWLPSLAEILQNRMSRIDPKRAESEIKAFVAAIK